MILWIWRLKNKKCRGNNSCNIHYLGKKNYYNLPVEAFIGVFNETVYTAFIVTPLHTITTKKKLTMKLINN